MRENVVQRVVKVIIPPEAEVDQLMISHKKGGVKNVSKGVS